MFLEKDNRHFDVELVSLFSYSFGSIYCDFVNVVILLSLHRNLSFNSFIVSFRGESFASTEDVLKAHVYILIPSLCILTSVLVFLGKCAI